MKNRTLVSVAILKANWDIRHSDYIENFVSLFSNLLKVKKYKEIDVDQLGKDFKSEYGLSIPYHPLMVILTRLKKKGFIYRDDNKYLVREVANDEQDFESTSQNQQRKLNKLINSLVEFGAKENFILNEESAEQALIGFFKNNELSFLFAAKGQAVLPTSDATKSSNYIVAKFIQHAKDGDPEIFSFLVDVAVGVALASTILYGEDLKSFMGSNKGSNFYFDTGYLLSLLGVNGEEKRKAFELLTVSMLDSKAGLYVFEHTYDEMSLLLTAALSWINKKNYDIQKASRVLKFFLNNNYTETDIEIFIAKIPSILDKYSIKKIPKPSYNKDSHYQIDEAQLKELLLEEYKNSQPFDESQKDYTLNKDIDSVYSICKLRHGRIAYTIKDASHIFVTTNTTLARLSSKVQSEDNAPFSIPPCVTDVFIGTVIWLQNPIQSSLLSEKKLIADAYAAVQPDSYLIKRYVEELDTLKKKEEISNVEYLFLKTNRVAHNILTEKTRNDGDNFKTATSREILDQINKEHIAELNKRAENYKIISEEKTREVEIKNKEIENKEFDKKVITERYDKSVKLFTTLIVWLILPAIIGIFVVSLFVITFPTPFDGTFIRILAFILTTMVSVLGIGIPQVKKWIFNGVKKYLISNLEK